MIQYITWISGDVVAWTLKAGGMAADTTVEIGPRPIPEEPMVRRTYISSPLLHVLNFG